MKPSFYIVKFMMHCVGFRLVDGANLATVKWMKYYIFLCTFKIIGDQLNAL